MTIEELCIFAVPIVAGIPDTLAGQWWAALAGLAIIVLLRPRRMVASRHHG